MTQRLRLVLFFLALGGLGAFGFFSRSYWIPWLQGDPAASSSVETAQKTTSAPTGKVLLSDQAINNLQLVAKPVHPQTWWRSIQVPGMVVDRPGLSDRRVVAPVAGLVVAVEHFPGDAVRAGDMLFRIRLLSESLHLTQSDLFKASQDIKLVQTQRKRLGAFPGAVPEARLIELDNQITRLEVSVKAYRRALLDRGLLSSQIDQAEEGRFLQEMVIKVPEVRDPSPPSIHPIASPPSEVEKTAVTIFEVQDLKVELGQQVQAGQTLCFLADHRILAVEGRAFRDETPLLERTLAEGWPVEVDFQEDAASGWPPLDRTYRIKYLSNTIDPVNRTFSFRIPLENQSRKVVAEGRTQMLWRFRPGQKVRLSVRVEKLEDVYVLPAEAVARDFPEAFVFTQNVNTFERKSVRILSQDRRQVVVAADKNLVPGMYVVQNVAAQLNRLAKSQSDTTPKGYHVHADGSLHKNEDEGK